MAEPNRRTVRVVAALIFRGDAVLAQQRRAGTRHALLWEFPGGKIEPGESAPDALVRECREELAVEIGVEHLFERVCHAYPDFDIELSLYRAKILSGEIQNLQAADVRFVPLNELSRLPFTEADRPFVARLEARARRAHGGGDAKGEEGSTPTVA
ncbi:MAG: (deoxy)nucleoside triphosphate pyrophosphohydrolase [Myxococcales bacterium]|jgi:8-oxo-dGTP diphosphatase|nr:(deoxy)nucleoside triphosphate pyrophosphohydrolase [Myxococcales bacterium]